LTVNAKTLNTLNRSAKLVIVGLGWFPNSPGGNERYVYELTRQLVQRELGPPDQVELCAPDLPAPALDSTLILTNLGSADLPLWKRLWVTRKNFLGRRLSNPDGVNLHFTLYSLPMLASIPKGCPITFTFHGPWALESQVEGANPLSVASKRWMERWVYARCDRFIVLSQAFGTILHDQYGVPQEAIHQIPGGVDLERFQPQGTRSEARAQLQWPQDRMILFTPRRLVQRMGLDRLLAAIATLTPRYPELWVAIAGKGPLREALEAQVQTLGLADQVKFLGFLPDADLPVAYTAADLTVIPSQALEGFGLILLESMACGTPVMCTPVGGMPEVIQSFSPDLILSGLDEGAIATGLASVLSGKVPLPTAADCRTYVRGNFNWVDIAERVRAVLLAPVKK
jgi:glycosyltransferase involved in cell wall biosynthesis